MVSSISVGTYTISGRIGARPLADTVDAESAIGPVCVQDFDPTDGVVVIRVEVTLNGREAGKTDLHVVSAYEFGRDCPVSSIRRGDLVDARSREADLWISELIPHGSPVTDTVRTFR